MSINTGGGGSQCSESVMRDVCSLLAAMVTRWFRDSPPPSTLCVCMCVCVWVCDVCGCVCVGTIKHIVGL